ncbi:MAG: hypothetical protein ACRDCE_00935 [Cetobacterium sp.]|uniref:hypothetical protein n=1 Tax=Cetobacterium sp. TaxID=2071632 RepID=UPI003EE63BE6
MSNKEDKICERCGEHIDHIGGVFQYCEAKVCIKCIQELVGVKIDFDTKTIPF